MKSKRSKENFNYSAQLLRLEQESPTRHHFQDISNLNNRNQDRKSPNLITKYSPLKQQTTLNNLTPRTPTNFQEKTQSVLNHVQTSSLSPVTPRKIQTQRNEAGKDKSAKRRDFFLQINHISQMDSHISSLLSLVKDTDRKSGIKQTTEQKSDRKQTPMKVTLFDCRSEASQNLSVEKQSEIVSQFTMRERIEKENEDFGKKWRNESEKEEGSCKNDEEGKRKERAARMAERSERSERIQKMEKDIKESYQPRRREKYDFESEISICKQEDIITSKLYTFQEEENRQKTLPFNKPDGELKIQSGRKMSWFEKKEHEKNSYELNIGAEITKIRERIQFSEQNTKKMEEKYLGRDIEEQSRKVIGLKDRILNQNRTPISQFPQRQERQEKQERSSRLQRKEEELIQKPISSSYKNQEREEFTFQEKPKERMIERSLSNWEKDWERYEEKKGKAEAIECERKQENFEEFAQNTNNFTLKIYPCCYNEYSQKEVESRIIERERSVKAIRGKNLKLDKEDISKKIAEKLAHQVKVDKKLREKRERFLSLEDQAKWRKLRDGLNHYGLYFTQKQLCREVEFESGEANPFEESRSEDPNAIASLEETFYEAEQIWKKELSGTISSDEVERCSYSGREVDLERRGFINIQDLVCFVNLYTSNFFRNRDVYHTFRRFCRASKSEEKVSYQIFVNKFC